MHVSTKQNEVEVGLFRELNGRLQVVGYHRFETQIQPLCKGKGGGRAVDEKGLERATKYLIKYIEKSGERLVYSRGIYMYFMTDILEDDVLCNTGPDEYKVILADDFYCIKDGEVIGNVSPEVIDKMEKCN